MAWLLIISSVVVIWIASLFKILHGSYSPSKGTFLNDSNNGGSAKKRNVLLFVAHPDDESIRCEIELKISSEGVQLSNPKPERVQIAEEADDNDDGEKEKDADVGT
ncbi:hypothetical protein ABKV19_012794 [Rosa sericea]